MYIVHTYEKALSFCAEGSWKNRDGLRISYKVISEETVLGNEKGEAEATVFSYSYIRTDIEKRESRPVIFLFNGGPGSSSMWLHLGMAAPLRIRLDCEVNPSPVPPYGLEENADSLLDVCDLVMLDPVDTGYARLLNLEAAPCYFGAMQDAQAMAMVIRDWLIRYNRYDSPKYLLSESYGTIRSALLLREFSGGHTTNGADLAAISLNGVIMLGSALLYEGYGDPVPVWPEILKMPAWAATNRYHHPQGKPELKQFVNEAWAFAGGEYLNALFAGENLEEEAKKRVARKLEYFTGIPESLFLAQGLRLDDKGFARNVLRKEGLDVGIYDSRYTVPHMPFLKAYDTVADDPAMGQYIYPFVGTMEGDMKRALGIKTQRPYLGINFRAGERWGLEGMPDPIQCVVAALRRHRKLHLFFASGLYDLCTHPGYVRYLVSHYGLPSSQMTVKEYPSGHMPYLGADGRGCLMHDIREFISQTL